MEVITNEKIYFKINYHFNTYLLDSVKNYPYFYFEIPYIQHLESVAPYNDIPVNGDRNH